MTADEIAETAAACREAGAAMIHLHVRDADGGHCLDVDAYRAATAAIRRAAGNDLIVQPTTESGGRYASAQQMDVVRHLRPETVSLAVREIVPDTGHEADASAFLGWLRSENIAPQYILYSAGEARRYRDLRRRGVIPGDCHYLLLVVGRYGDDADPRALVPLLAASGEEQPWMACAFGAGEAPSASAAAGLGGHVRVGFENNLALADGSVAPDNAALVRQTRTMCETIGRPVASPDAVRELLFRS